MNLDRWSVRSVLSFFYYSQDIFKSLLPSSTFFHPAVMEDMETLHTQAQTHSRLSAQEEWGGIIPHKSTKIKIMRLYTLKRFFFQYLTLSMLPLNEGVRTFATKSPQRVEVKQWLRSWAFQIVYTWGLYWPWRSTTQQNNHLNKPSVQIWPLEIKTGNGVGPQSETSPVFQLGHVAADGLYTLPNMLLYTLLHVTNWAKGVCINRKKKKANASMIYMDAVVSNNKERI